MDELEQYINENRSAFETELNSNHEARFSEKLVGKNHSNPWRWAWLAAACITAFVVVLNAKLNTNDTALHPSKSVMSLSEVSPEMAEVEAFYSEEILTSERQLKSLSDDKSNSQLLQEQLQFLAQQYNFLEIELAQSPGEERIIKNMIENYRNRLKLLEKHLSMIQKYQQLKSTVYESV